MNNLEETKDHLIHRCQLLDYPISILMTYYKENDSYFVFGPIKTEKMTPIQERNYAELCKKYRFSNYIFYCTNQTMLTELSLVLSIIRQQMISENDLLDSFRTNSDNLSEEKEKIEYMLAQIEEGMDNHSFVEELVIIDAVASGDVNLIKNKISQMLPSYPQAVSNYRKNEEYMAVAMVAVMCRVAMSVGVSSREALLQSDVFLKQIANSSYAEEYGKIRTQVILTYTKMVSQHLSLRSENIHVENCKKYIKQHLLESISLSIIADYLCISPSYLSRLFTSFEGISVGDYILNKKIDLAKEILSYSDKTVAEISEYLSFKSQSYFTRMFKKHTKETPTEFRLRHQIRN